MIHEAIGALEIRLARGLREDAERADLREATARLLLVLGPAEAVAMAEVARRMGRDPSTATRFADRAQADGLLARGRGASDGRRRLARLTPAGDAARARLLALRHARAEALLDHVQGRTGLGAVQVEWFLEAMLRSLERPVPAVPVSDGSRT